jgi:hypothetical protein
MVQVNELRVGNILKINGVIVNIDERTIFDFKHDKRVKEPVVITEKILKDFGFFIVETNKCVEAFRENFRYTIQQVENSKHWFWCDGETVLTNLEYVHELQNLYFALSRTELTTN